MCVFEFLFVVFVSSSVKYITSEIYQAKFGAVRTQGWFLQLTELNGWCYFTNQALSQSA